MGWMRSPFFIVMCFKAIKVSGVVSRTLEEVGMGMPGKAVSNSIREDIFEQECQLWWKPSRHSTMGDALASI